MQRLARDKIQRILEEQEKMNYELEKKRRQIESWTKELNKRETLTERERMKLDEDKKKVFLYCIIFLCFPFQESFQSPLLLILAC